MLGKEYRSVSNWVVVSVLLLDAARPWSVMATRPAQAGAAALVPPTSNQPEDPLYGTES